MERKKWTIPLYFYVDTAHHEFQILTQQLNSNYVMKVLLSYKNEVKYQFQKYTPQAVLTTDNLEQFVNKIIQVD